MLSARRLSAVTRAGSSLVRRKKNAVPIASFAHERIGQPGRVERDVEPVERIGRFADRFPIRHETATIVAPGHAIAAVEQRPREHHAQVVPLGQRRRQPRARRLRFRRRADALGKFAIVGDAARVHVGRVAVEREPFARVLARRLQKAIAIVRAVRFHQHERFVDELRDVFVDARRRADRRSRTRRPRLRASTFRQTPRAARRAARSGGLEELIAPVDQRAQRLLARQRGAAAAGEHAETRIEPFAELLHGHRAQTRRREFDRERNAVEPARDVHDGARRCDRRARTTPLLPRASRRIARRRTPAHRRR